MQKIKKIKFLSDMRVRIQIIPTTERGGGGGGGGGGGRIASRGRFVPLFILGNKWQLIIFMGRSGPHAPSVPAHIRVSNSLNSNFIIFFFAGPGQFTKRLLIISADAKAKYSMIYLRSKRPRELGSYVMVALTHENVHYTLNSGPGVMNKSNWVHARIQEFLSGGGVEARQPENSLDNVCFSHQLILQFTEWIQWFKYRGEEGVQLLPGGGGVQRNRYNL